ncbi:MAG: ATP-binding cassette domain-containing protein [Acidobacteriota bacterium]
MPDSAQPPAVAFEEVAFAFDDHVVLDKISFTVPAGSMRIILGGSGAGKSVILKLILGLYRPDAGVIRVNGERIDNLPERQLLRLRADIGMLFQETALFDSLTVEENVGYRLFEELRLPLEQARARVAEVLGFVGLAGLGQRLPSELSGGQRRRVGLARAVAAEPSLLLFDDPTTGLDPVIASNVNDEIVKLRDLGRATSILVTHQIRDAYEIATREVASSNGQVTFRDASPKTAARVRFMLLRDGRIGFEGSADELLASEDPYIREFLFNTLPPW